jgi:uncharacterized Ntn-hydrolase superfamily protein
VTFSLVARSRDASLFGVVVASSSPAVAARCAQARAGLGAVTSQNITDPTLRERLLEALGRGLDAAAAMREVLSGTRFAAYRQLLAIGRAGPAAIHSGERTLGRHAGVVGTDAAAAGNLLAHEEVPGAMLAAFERAQVADQSAPAAGAERFAERLLAALRAGADRGGEEGPIHSAGLLLVREVSWPIVDLRVDWSGAPISDLTELWRRYAPQLEDYVRRALDPAAAPSFGVPGDR